MRTRKAILPDAQRIHGLNLGLRWRRDASAANLGRDL